MDPLSEITEKSPNQINMDDNNDVDDDDDNEIPSPLPISNIENQQQNQSTTNLSRTVSISNLSRVSSRIDKTFRQMASRIQVANKLSMAKRKEENLAINSGTLLEESNLRSKSIKKIVKQLSPMKSTNRQYYQDQDGGEIVKEGIISGGNLIFDIDYPLASDSMKTISRPYIYLTSDVEMKNITNVMFNEWHLSIPRIALFLLPDPDHFRTWNNSRQMSSFRTGVMKVCFIFVLFVYFSFN